MRITIIFQKLSASLLVILLCIQVYAQKNEYTKYKLKHSMYKKEWIDFNKNGIKDVYEDPTQPIDLRIENLLSQMNLEEKTCQMVTLYGYGRVLKDDLPTPDWKNKLWKDGMGAIDEHLNGFQQWGLPPSSNPYVWPASKHAWALNEVQRFFIEDTRLGIPTDFTNEGIRGVESYIATNFPTQLGIGHTWNRELVHRIGEITGLEARALGYTNVYAPILDVGRDQRWGRYEEVYGESPYLVAELGTQMTRGMQKDYKVASTAKHYIAYSNNKGAREGMSRVDPQMSPREVEMIHVIPFLRVIRDANILGVMSSYNDYNGEPIQSSKYWLTDRLRGEMGFKGYVVSDSDAVEYLHSKHNTSENMKESVRQSVEAGLNVRCTFRSPDSYVLPLRELVEEGAVSMETIDDRVRDILRVKFLVGLFDQPYQIDLEYVDEIVASVEHEAVALQAARESMVLLKNKNNILPLDKNDLKKIAICGPNANEKSFALTHYGPLAVEVTTVLGGIKAKVGSDVEVSYTKGCDLVDANWPQSEILDFPITIDEQNEINKAVENAKKSDVIIAVVGGGVRTCGENKSRSDIKLPGRQEDLLKALHATGKPMVVVLINGRPLAVNWAEANVDAILEAWYSGAKGGEAAADILFGDYNPSGKLTVTFPKHVGQIPFNFPSRPFSQVDGGRSLGTKGNQSRINGSLYPFGYGLSYTKFKYSDLQIHNKTITPKQDVKISFKVKNIGERDGDEIVQLYIRDVVSSITTYEKNLCGFDRISLKSGEEKRLEMIIKSEDMALFNRYNKWIVESGEFRVMIGASSTDIRLKGSYVVAMPHEIKNMTIKESKTNAVSASVNTDKAKNVIDKNSSTVWSGSKGEYITISLPPNSAPKQVQINWALAAPKTKFELQLSSGGGQFITVYTGEITETNKAMMYPFASATASDFRILIKKGSVSIAEVIL